MAENENLEPGWSYKPGSTDAQQAQSPQPELANSAAQPEQAPNNLQQSVSWTASEFVSNHKDARWHAGYILVFAIVIGLIFTFTKDIISVVVIGIAAFLFLVLANNKPRQLQYEVNNKGINIGSKYYPYESFKSFSLSAEEAVGCINFIPLHRFSPEISIYFPPEQGDKIMNIIAQHLPNDQTAEKKVDRLFKKLHF